jgi:Kef-type K+ transport system membrane component KefB
MAMAMAMATGTAMAMAMATGTAMAMAMATGTAMAMATGTAMAMAMAASSSFLRMNETLKCFLEGAEIWLARIRTSDLSKDADVCHDVQTSSLIDLQGLGFRV